MYSGTGEGGQKGKTPKAGLHLKLAAWAWSLELYDCHRMTMGRYLKEYSFYHLFILWDRPDRSGLSLL